MSEIKLTKGTEHLAKKMLGIFTTPFLKKEKLTLAKKIVKALPARYRISGEAFISALEALHDTTTFPFTVIYKNIIGAHRNRIFMAETIGSLKIVNNENEPDLDLEKRRRANANKMASIQIDKFLKSKKGINLVTSEVANYLIDIASVKPSIPQELLYQGCVGLWSALEVLIRDNLISYLNEKPKLAKLITENPKSKKHFELPRITFDYLEDYSFNLSKKMGDLLIEPRDMSDLKSMKIALFTIFPSASLRKAMNNKTLWELNQIRHLIVHKRGIADEKYIANTNKKIKIGTNIHIKPLEFERYFMAVVDVGTAIIKEIGSKV